MRMFVSTLLDAAFKLRNRCLLFSEVCVYAMPLEATQAEFISPTVSNGIMNVGTCELGVKLGTRIFMFWRNNKYLKTKKV
jgi:hypothetical protein